MTTHLADIASYQGALRPQAVWDAGFRAVNLKISHGLGQKSVHPDAAAWVSAWRALGGGISTFHYFTGDAAGVAQADHALSRMAALGLLYDTAHQLDVECTPAPLLADVRSYLAAMQDALHRLVIVYTGDWWWQARPGWNVSDLTPYVWAAPNQGYLGNYPGDDSAHWRAGYGGWESLAAMQYSDRRLISGIEVSATAIRDPRVWVALRRGRTTMTSNPATLLDARALWREETGLSAAETGISGDAAHADGGDSYHLGADQLRASASYSVKESSRDGDPTNDASALDIGWWTTTIGGKIHDLRTFSVWLVEQCRAGAADTRDIREVIYSDDGKTVKRWDRIGKRTTGSSSHLYHTHVSYFRDSLKTGKRALYERYFREIKEGDMPTAAEVAAEVVKQLTSGDVLYNAVNKDKIREYDTDPATGGQVGRTPTAADNGYMTVASALTYTVKNGDWAKASIVSLHRKVDALTGAIEVVAKNVAADDDDLAAILARIEAAKAEIIAEIASAE